MTTTLARLLAKKQELIERLQENPGPEEREQIERLLEQVNAALDLLEKAGPGTSD
jgi:DNA-binding MarR family transcriptional regulator